MISTLVREVMRRHKLQQKDLAAVLGVNIDRVKSLSSGRAKKLSAEEMDALVSKLRVRPDYIVSGGVGEMLMTQREHSQWMAAHALKEAPRPQPPADVTLQVGDQVFHYEVKTPPPPPLAEQDREPYVVNVEGLDEMALIEKWRRCAPTDRQVIAQLVTRLAEVEFEHPKGVEDEKEAPQLMRKNRPRHS